MTIAGMLGLALLGNLISGVVGYVVGRIVANREAQRLADMLTLPTRTIEVYEGTDVPF